MRWFGILLIGGIVLMFFFWLRFQRRQESAEMGSSGQQEVTIVVKGAYNPNVVTVKAGVPVRIHFDRQEEVECSRFVSFPDLKLRKDLVPHAVTAVEFTPTKPGEFSFTCDMGMYQGKVVVQV